VHKDSRSSSALSSSTSVSSSWFLSLLPWSSGLEEREEAGDTATSWSQNRKQPTASSISDIPSDQMSDLTEYSATCIRSGCGDYQRKDKRRDFRDSYTHVY
jgi:hypothetical protein